MKNVKKADHNLNTERVIMGAVQPLSIKIIKFNPETKGKFMS